VPALERGLEVYAETFTATWRGMLADKLGLTTLDRAGDEDLVRDLFGVLQQTETDMTLFFRGLALASANNIEPLRGAFYQDGEPSDAHRARLVDWLRQYENRLQAEAPSADERRARMNRANPKYVLRNYQAQQAIDAATEGDVAQIERLLHVLEAPYDEQPEHQDLAQRRPEWARNKAGCSALSCSS
jgi:protein adenylyltransferase